MLVLKKGQGYIENSCYVMCNLNINLLPIKLNLPMLCKPLDWQPAERGSDPDTLSDLIGGYLCKPTGDIKNHFRLLTSHDLNHFYIKLHKKEYKQMCDILNGLQSQAFEINKRLLRFLEKNRQCLVECGLLLPNALARVNPTEASDILRECYFNNVKGIKNACSYNILLNKL